ncbi:MAG: acyltransferase family protein [Candidatus Bathyarchaeota archaeon]|nr:acyltransferase family protein [Candidatus Bathyarchaeota archaeon]
MAEKLNKLGGRTVYVDLIRATAMVGVIMLHASGQWLMSSQEFSQLNMLDTVRWVVVDVYQSVSVISVPLFLMLTGALLLQSEKKESLNVFFKKRWSRIGLPFFFWTSAYFVWDFVVAKIPVSPDVIAQGLLNGPYTHMWYMYVLVGLYLLTPIVRIFIANADPTIIKYFVLLWFMGVATIPFFNLLTIYQLHSSVFTVTGYVGYFVLGAYLSTVQMRRKTITRLMILGMVLTVFATYVMTVTVGGADMYFFQEYLSPTVILASVMMFLLLFTVKPPSGQNEAGLSKINKLVKLISENTLPIYLFHVMIIESLQNGFFGFAINRNTLNPIVEVPLLTAIVLFVSLGTILLLKKVPYLKQLIGCAPTYDQRTRP